MAPIHKWWFFLWQMHLNFQKPRPLFCWLILGWRCNEITELSVSGAWKILQDVTRSASFSEIRKKSNLQCILWDLFLQVKDLSWRLSWRQISIKLLQLHRCSISLIKDAFLEIGLPPFLSLSHKEQLKSLPIITSLLKSLVGDFAPV